MFRLVPWYLIKNSCSSITKCHLLKNQKRNLTGGLITEAHQTEEIISSGKADLVLFARESLRNPYCFNLCWRFK
jgi:2,4-dienoyl-CoA reductase-like NADH-dependent reductase (Old Yellow Enzyme family)